jgi:FkbM family methyltransferase
MAMAVRSALHIARTLHKLYLDTPGRGRSKITGIRNAGEALKFLATRKLGIDAKATLVLGHAGQRHRWRLVERSDLSVLEEIFLDGEYALDVPAPNVVLDLGANFGAATVYFAQLWPAARIYSVEPNPELFRRLRQTTSAYPNVTCINCAVGGRDGRATFFISDDHIGSSLKRDESRGSPIEVELRTLRSLMGEHEIAHADVVKFDVEGAEADLFSDVSVLNSITTLVGEVHPDLMGMEAPQFLERFRDFTLTTRWVAAGRFVMKAARLAK